MNRLEHLIEELNSALYNPVGLNILWPRDVGFLFVRFPARVADDRLTNHGHSVLFCVARDRILRQLPFTRSDDHACLMSRSDSNDANLVGSPPPLDRYPLLRTYRMLRHIVHVIPCPNSARPRGVL